MRIRLPSHIGLPLKPYGTFGVKWFYGGGAQKGLIMPQDVKITCVKKTNRMNPHERIHSIGGINSNGTPWRLTTDEAIIGIETGRWTFHTGSGWTFARVIIARHNGHKYLKTEADGFHPNNLLALPECLV